MNAIKLVSIVFVIGVNTLVIQQASALAILLGDAEKGGKVLNEKCSACHVDMFGGDGSEIYKREDHKIKTVEGLMQQVELCNTNALKGELDAEALDDITSHLNETYYQYDD